MKRILVTGADGFVGRHVVEALLSRGCAVRPIARNTELAARFTGFGYATEEPFVVGDIGPETNWTEALAGVDAVIHLAARVHVMNETTADPLAAFREVNTAGTERLAREAAHAGVRRLAFVSTIKVNGESTTGRNAFRGDDPPSPEDPYGTSKHEAELALSQIASETNLETVVLRPPLVHGKGVGGNLLRLLGLVDRGIPLPFNAVQNRRSLIAVENLADVLALSIEHPAAAGKTYTVADANALAMPELIRDLAVGLERPARLLTIPVPLLSAGLKMLGKGALVDRVLGSLEVDTGPIMNELGWDPPVEVHAGLRAMGQWFRNLKSDGRGSGSSS